jgi:hypothetical protein
MHAIGLHHLIVIDFIILKPLRKNAYNETSQSLFIVGPNGFLTALKL